MNVALSALYSPVVVLLLKWTALLALGWAIDSLSRNRQARLRQIVWRSILCFGLVLPATAWVPRPLLPIPLPEPVPGTIQLEQMPQTAANRPGVPVQSAAAAPRLSAAKASGSAAPVTASAPKLVASIRWALVLLVAWALGCSGAAIRLSRLEVQLHRLKRGAVAASGDLRQLATRIRNQLGIKAPVVVRLSDTVRSPFICGLRRPTVVLPTRMAQELPEAEMTALLSHEIAHLCHRDLLWSFGWRWMRALCWFHPLVWGAPAAHNLACEEEADRVASGHVPECGSYPRYLAQLALRVLSLPVVETEFTLNGASQIARRLEHLSRAGAGVWTWKHSLVGFSVVGGLFLLAVLSGFSQPGDARSGSGSTNEFREVLITVQDEAGEPIAGATILPDGFRVKGVHSADGYHWGPQLLGGPVKAVTDSQGKAWVKYPLMGIPEEKEFTGVLIFSVSHPEFSTVRLQDYSVDGTEPPVRLQRGIILEVSGYYGPQRQPVLELVPNLSQEGLRPEDWQKKDNGVLAYHKLSPGGHLVQLMGRLPSGDIVFSEGLAFMAEKGQAYKFAIEMKQGIRLEGRLDQRVPRPVTNGRVVISVRPKEFPAFVVPEDYRDLTEKYGYLHFWKTYRPIAEDGTFVFESIPPGEVDVIVHGDGFVSRNGGEPRNRVDGQLTKGLVIGVPQAFPLSAPVTRVEVATEPTATLEVTAKTPSGEPVEGATVYVNPNVMRMQTGYLGTLPESGELPFRTPPPLPKSIYSATTDKNGVAVIRNVPAINRGVEIFHPSLQVPLQEPKSLGRRYIRLTFSPGETHKLAVTLEPKGTDFTGAPK